MSAYFVSRETIDLLVSAAVELKFYGKLGNSFTQVTAANADLFGRMLWLANAESVAARYRIDNQDEASEMRADANAYRWTQYASITDAAIVACAHCYDYQSSETDGFEGSDAHLFALGLQAAIGKKLAPNGPYGVDGRGGTYEITQFARRVRAAHATPAPAPVARPSNVVALRIAPAPAAKPAKAAPVKGKGFDDFRARLAARRQEIGTTRPVR